MPAMKQPESLRHSPSRKRVICVDDNDFILEILHWYLQSRGYLVTRCSSGEQALEVMAQELPDAVTLDFEMPGADGGQVALAMKARAPHVPIVMFSGSPNVSEQTLDLVDRFVAKDAVNGFALLADALDSILGQVNRRHTARSAKKKQAA